MLVFWPMLYKHRLNQITKLTNTHVSILIGLQVGIIGLILGFFSLNELGGVIYSARLIFVLFAGMFGGPISILLTGFIMTIGRLFLYPTAEFGAFFTFNSLAILIIITLFAAKYRIHFQNIHLYLYFTLFEVSILFLIHYDFTIYGFRQIILMDAFIIGTFWIIYFFVYQSHATSQKALDMMALEQIDYLTQLPNNYAIEAYLKNQLHGSANLSFMHIDIDQFKNFNSQYSYLIGDHILQETARLIKEFANKKDGFVGRIGGSEFCFIMKGVPPAVAVHEANALRDCIENHTFGTADGLNLSITVSIGISSLPENGTTIEQLFNRAFTALQASKKTHENHVYHYSQYLKDLEFLKQ